MDFTTFLSFSLRNTMQYGGKIEPEISDAQYAYYSDMLHDIESGKIATEKFDSLEALRSSYR